MWIKRRRLDDGVSHEGDGDCHYGDNDDGYAAFDIGKRRMAIMESDGNEDGDEGDQKQRACHSHNEHD